MDEQRLNQLSLLTRALQSVDVWLSVTYLAGMFAVAGFRPQHIASGVLFRLSFLVFGTALAVPLLADGLVSLVHLSDTSRRSQPAAGWQLVSTLGYLVGRLLFAVGVILGLASLQVGPGRPEPPKVRPVEREEG